MIRVLEDSAGGETGCGVTSDGLKQHIESENFAQYKKFNGLRSQLQMRRLAADGDSMLPRDCDVYLRWGLQQPREQHWGN